MMTERFSFSCEDRVHTFCTHYAGAAGVFDALGLPMPDDQATLQDHCEASGRDPVEALMALARSLRWQPVEDDGRHGEMLLDELVDDILFRHHAFLDAELGRLRVLITNGCTGPESFKEAFRRFRELTIEHLDEEEAELFPLVGGAEAAIDAADALTRHVGDSHQTMGRAVLQLCRLANEAAWIDPGIAVTVCDTLGVIRHDLKLHGEKEDEYLIPGILHRIEAGRRHL